MAKYSNLNAPVTNPQAAQRIADTQAIRARSLAGQVKPGTAIGPTAAQAGASLTQQAGQQAIQQQAQDANLAKGQTGLQLQQQGLQNQQNIFNQEQALQQSALKLDQQLFDISEDAANEEAQLRNDFSNRVAQTGYLQDVELLDWALLNSQNEEQFKGKIQEIEQAHAKKTTLINHSYKLIMQDLKQKQAAASQDRKQELSIQLQQIEDAWNKEKAKQAAEAANRSAMAGAFSTLVGAGVAGATIAVTGGAAAPFAPAIVAGTSALMQGTGASNKILGG